MGWMLFRVGGLKQHDRYWPLNHVSMMKTERLFESQGGPMILNQLSVLIVFNGLLSMAGLLKVAGFISALRSESLEFTGATKLSGYSDVNEILQQLFLISIPFAVFPLTGATKLSGYSDVNEMLQQLFLISIPFAVFPLTGATKLCG